MVRLAQIVRRHAAAFVARFGSKALPGQLHALGRILACRTVEAGVVSYHCPKCQQVELRPASCGHRSCGQCGQHRAMEWEAKQQKKLLPAPYFMVTFTVPSQLRQFFYAHQRIAYDLFFKTSSNALLELGRDPKHLGGEMGFTGVLHTWKRDLGYHAHIHYLVPGGASGPHGWVQPKKAGHLLTAPVLATVMRNRFRDALRKVNPDLWRALPSGVWKRPWNVNLQAVGSGAKAFAYLARYVQKTAIDANRILACDAETVTYTWIDRKTQQRRVAKVPGAVFIQRFVQHVLPRGLVRVRHYGYLASAAKRKLAHVREQLRMPTPGPAEQPAGASQPANKREGACCKKCQQPLKFIAFESGPKRPPSTTLLDRIAIAQRALRASKSKPPAAPPTNAANDQRDYRIRSNQAPRPPPAPRP
jgi:Putative transposase/Transposase zinc-binding domain